MTENNESTNPEDTANNVGEAFIESMQTQAAEAVEAAEDADTNPAGTEPTEAESAEAESVEAEPAEAEPEAEEAAAEGDADADYRRRLRKYTKELKELPGQWYIIQC